MPPPLKQIAPKAANRTLVKAGRTAGRIEHQNQQNQQETSATDVWTRGIGPVTDRILEFHSDPAGTLRRYSKEGGKLITDSLDRDFERSAFDQYVESSNAQQAALGKQVQAIADADGALATVGATFAMLTSVEQIISAPVSMIPFPAFPALRISDLAVGLPHAHNHPPNLTPAGLIPLPSMGPVIPIPFLSGANQTTINGMPAARCGDMGLGIWCGGYFPLYEVFFGSSNVWIEGARASRMAVDITSHCVFSSRKKGAQDTPIGPMIGFTITGSPNVAIGGVPMPSLLSLAMGKAMQGLFRGLGKLAGKLKSAKPKAFSRVAAEGAHLDYNTKLQGPPKIDFGPKNRAVAQRLLDDVLGPNGSIRIIGDMNFIGRVRKDLEKIALSKTGQRVLEDTKARGHPVEIDKLNTRASKEGPFCLPKDPKLAKNKNKGSGSFISYDPEYGAWPHTPSDATLMHELGHAASNSKGTSKHGVKFATEAENARWTDLEEAQNITNVDNVYRDEWGLPRRTGHNHVPVGRVPFGQAPAG